MTAQQPTTRLSPERSLFIEVDKIWRALPRLSQRQAIAFIFAYGLHMGLHEPQFAEQQLASVPEYEFRKVGAEAMSEHDEAVAGGGTR